MNPILIAVLALVAGAGVGFVYQNYLTKQKKPTKKEESSKEELPTSAKEIIIEARDQAFRIKKEAEEEARKIRSEVMSLEARLAAKEESIEEKMNDVERKEKTLAERNEELEKTKNELVTKLEKVAGITRDEAKKLILEATESHLKEEIARRIKESEEQVKKDVDEKSKSILVDAMKHGATDYVAEYTTSTVKLPDDEMKGRIIGREGRNIKSFEMATGVDVDLDDPGIIRLSSFDGERRELLPSVKIVVYVFFGLISMAAGLGIVITFLS